MPCLLPDRRLCAAALALLLLLTSAQGGASERFDLSASEFRGLSAAQQALDPQALDEDLLAAALFHETNRVREAAGRVPLQHLEQAAEAARMQSRLMAEDGEVRHENPSSEEMRTLEERIRLAGLMPRYAAENVASGFLLQYRSGEPFYRRDEGDRRIFSDRPGGPPIPPHSYASFAEETLRRWMQSPGHRANILDETPRYLGTAAVPARDEVGMWMLYATQVFFTPLDGSAAN